MYWLCHWFWITLSGQAWRRLLYFLTSRLCQLMCWRFFGPPPSLTWGFGPGRSGVGGAKRFMPSSVHTLLNLLFDLIAQSSFNPDILGKHTQVNLCLQRQAWQQKPLRKVHCLVPRWSGSFHF